MEHADLWSGRDDSAEQGDTRRLHQVVQRDGHPGSGDTVLMGFACDAGVQRNHGRPGANEAPAEARRKLAGLPIGRLQRFWDAGDVSCEGDALEAAQQALAGRVTQLLDTGARLVVLGGGHETAWGDFQGLRDHLFKDGSGGSLAIINFDAHFDLRTSRPGSSGTPFDQILEDSRTRGLPVRYACFGISAIGNTAGLYAHAKALGVQYVEDHQMQERFLSERLAEISQIVDTVEHVYLTIDTDVLPAYVAPGVSAPAPLGVPLCVLEACIQLIHASGKLRLADIAEFNPRHDIDGRTARVVARLVWHLLQP
ncbi:MAG TPA: formimidoylglutamase [Castellaniella sp.]|uniref:formimidoylglutamase n=1 Tax=Castellaniella sp. TaxID=1955812 RepID=UPI002F11FC99